MVDRAEAFPRDNHRWQAKQGDQVQDKKIFGDGDHDPSDAFHEDDVMLCVEDAEGIEYSLCVDGDILYSCRELWSCCLVEFIGAEKVAGGLNFCGVNQAVNIIRTVTRVGENRFHNTNVVPLAT